MTNKLLLKELPFCKAGQIITRCGEKFYIERGTTFYEGGGDSHNGHTVFEGCELELLKALWENEEWLGQFGGGETWKTDNSQQVILKFKTPMPADKLCTMVVLLKNSKEVRTIISKALVSD